MATTHDVLAKHSDPPRVLYRIEGQGKMRQGLVLRRDAEQALAEGATSVHVDLRDCSYMDSTFMGTLLYLFRAIRKEKDGDFSLVCPSDPCRRLLEELGIDTFCPILDESCPEAGWEEISRDPTDDSGLIRKVLQAHETLAELPGPAGEKFRRVVGCLRQEEGSEGRSPSDP